MKKNYQHMVIIALGFILIKNGVMWYGSLMVIIGLVDSAIPVVKEAQEWLKSYRESKKAKHENT